MAKNAEDFPGRGGLRRQRSLLDPGRHQCNGQLKVGVENLIKGVLHKA
ncbi:hypothetical protein [Desulfobulbus sp.]|nr:hypothetical protein [Desulfobulbus sp.]